MINENLLSYPTVSLNNFKGSFTSWMHPKL
jgi:hypothetical protein